MFRAVGSISRLNILHVHVEDDVIRRRFNGIFNIHFRLRDTADFVSPYITMGNPQ